MKGGGHRWRRCWWLLGVGGSGGVGTAPDNGINAICVCFTVCVCVCVSVYVCVCVRACVCVCV